MAKTKAKVNVVRENVEEVEIQTCDFGTVLQMLKMGRTARKLSWRDGLHIHMQRPDENSKMTKPYLYLHDNETQIPWTPDQEDCIEEDWVIM